MRIGKREVRRRLTGLTFPTVLGSGGGGATWTVEEGDRSRAIAVLNLLEDRRVLYDPYEVELPHACIESIREIRRYLRSIIEQCRSPELRDPLRAIQAACRQFLTETEAITARYGHESHVLQGGIPSWIINQALGALRARIGTSVAIIVQTFDIDVDEHLAQIMPPAVDDKETDNPELEPG